jgi:hypothetical protein
VGQKASDGTPDDAPEDRTEPEKARRDRIELVRAKLAAGKVVIDRNSHLRFSCCGWSRHWEFWLRHVLVA